MFIYLIVNHVTWKIYVGQHKGTNLKKYLQDKLSHAKYKTAGQSYLFRSMRKHPKDAWSIHPLLSDIQTRAELDHWEQTLIKALATQNPQIGYNICRGGEGFSGPHSPETRQKIAAASREMWQQPDIRKSITAKMGGRPVSPKTIEALRARRGTKASPETIQRLSLSHTGLRRSAESREKQSQSVTGSKNHFFGKKHSEETRKLMGVRSVRCKDTGEVFSSFVGVVEKFGGNKSNLSRAIKRGYKFAGNRFEYA
jgi:group I intron endonuclease